MNPLYVDAHDDSTLCVDFSDRVTVDPARLSTDGGATWRTSSFDCPTIARAGRHGDLVNLVPGEFLIRRSSDQGVTWTQALTDLPSTGPMQIVGDPSVTQGLYARGPTDVTWRYHSTDGGTQWTHLTVPSGVDTNNVTTELIDPRRAGTLVVYQAGHVWVTHDTGATWTPSAQTLPTAPDGFDAVGTLYVLSGSPMRSTNDGLTWSWKGSDLGGALPAALTVDPVTGSVYMLSSNGRYRLRDGGRSWLPLSPFGSSRTALGLPTAFAASAGTIVLPTDSGLARSVNAGRSFTMVPLAAGLPSGGTAITPVGTGPTFVAQGFLSPDRGATWNAWSNPAGDFFEPVSLIQGSDSTLPALLAYDASGMIWRSDDLAVSWQPWQQIGPNLQIDGATSRALYLSSLDAVVHGLAVFTTDTGLRPVTALDDLLVARVVTSPTRPALAVVLGTDSRHGRAVQAFVTRNAGGSWRRLALPVPRSCALADAALTPDARLVVALIGPTPSAAPFGPQACAVASVLSSRLSSGV